MHDQPPNRIEYGTFKSYFLGFLLSAILTIAAYYMAVEKIFGVIATDLTIVFFALAQVWLQLILFLNLNREPKPRWNLVVFLFMLLVTVLVVFGSIWIMYSLNYRLMP